VTLLPSDILDFWFEGDAAESRDHWFKNHADFDTLCARFTTAVRDARAGRYDEWAGTPKGGLALIILLDQLSRNIFRGQAEAFAADKHARQIARRLIDRGFDTQLTAVERMFVYLPFEHSENLADQDEAVRLFNTLRDALGEKTADYADRHRDAIRQFGRFPHRNAALGRISTPEENAWLARHESGF
jgi:uncharacterized protein (DUF924 family)